MTTFHYFAYGSNMLTERLQARCPSAAPLGPARAHGFSLAIAKRAADRSGKATLTRAADKTADERADGAARQTYGVLFEIHSRERHLLDRAEGPGYARDNAFPVALAACGSRFEASTYIARDDHMAAGLDPFCWYRALIIAGAEQHGLPADHIEDLRAQRYTPDPDPQRASHRQARAVLEAAGFAHLLP